MTVIGSATVLAILMSLGIILLHRSNLCIIESHTAPVLCAKHNLHPLPQTKFSVISYTVSTSDSQSGSFHKQHEGIHKQHEGIHKQLEVFN